MSRSRRYRSKGDKRRRDFRGTPRSPRSSPWKRAECCGATVAADPARMAGDWADVHEPGCATPWELLGLPGEPRQVYPGAAYLPPGTWLRAVNRKAGRLPANLKHLAAIRQPQ